MKNLLFNLGLATLFTHELDAVTQSEWHLLYMGYSQDTCKTVPRSPEILTVIAFSYQTFKGEED
ncbi:hypothetical protein APA_1366 [Pseudanabaena sp. lw0831]|uniref:DUF6713 family protein n=1 Tax=Pseudanabaena sp. lw0831 TaxID=1357935 RepID=UPI001915957E|nr:DUF6713 family protein [Pseudanabaena sp. lw0831]GBO53459.1 hypothetical protein APA_1366 [Pseudanabaena sp. lw0831]